MDYIGQINVANALKLVRTCPNRCPLYSEDRSQVLTVLPAGARMQLTGIDGSWFHVRYDYTTGLMSGWVLASDLDPNLPPPAPPATTTTPPTTNDQSTTTAPTPATGANSQEPWYRAALDLALATSPLWGAFLLLRFLPPPKGR